MLKFFFRTLAALAGATLLGYLLTRNMEIWELEVLKKQPRPSKSKPASGKKRKKPATARRPTPGVATPGVATPGVATPGSINFEKIGKASASEKDDLKKIKGIGPVIEKKLNAVGIYTFDQLASLTAEDEKQVEEAITFFPGRIERDEWVKQAKALKKK